MQASSSHPPLISVVVATYNGARYIREQLDSIIHQTYPNLEIVITDDRSTDETMSILEEYANQYSNIRVYQNETNLRYVKNFEKGMGLAKGDFIAPSDQDDIWELDKLQVLMDHIGYHAIVYCNSVLIDAAGKEMTQKLSDIKRLDSFDSCLNYAIGNSAPGHAMLIRKQVIIDCGVFPTMIPHDYWLGFVATFNSQVYFLDKVMPMYLEQLKRQIELHPNQRKFLRQNCKKKQGSGYTYYIKKYQKHLLQRSSFTKHCMKAIKTLVLSIISKECYCFLGTTKPSWPISAGISCVGGCFV
jgi:glycosyltransferase involved in cell wall biosynthesis